MKIELLKAITPEEKVKFADIFLKKFLENGFSTMPKREMEILIFHLLQNETTAFEDLDNYTIANLLKLSENRVKSFKSEVALKHKQISLEEALLQIASLIFIEQKIKPTFKDDEISFGLEDTVLLRQLKYAVKLAGNISDSSFNSEIVKIKTHIFIQIFTNRFPEIKKKLKTVIQEDYKDDKEAKKTLDKNLPWSKRIENILKTHEQKMNFFGNIFSPIKTILGGL